MCTAKLTGRPLNYYMSRSCMAVAKAKRDLLRQQLSDDSCLKGEFYRAAKEQARKFPGRRGVTQNHENLTPEEKAIVERGIEEIAQKFRDGERAPSISELIRKIDLSEGEIASIVKAAKRKSQFKRKREVQRICGGLKRIRRGTSLLPDSVWERTEFTENETEEERLMCMTEALCHAVRKYDLHEWGSRFFLSHDRPEAIVHDYVTNMLNDKCDEVATSSRECANAPADATIPPTFTSASAYRVFERVRPSLTARAARYFCPNKSGNTDLIPSIDADLIRKYTAYDRLNIQLHPNILIDTDYLKLKAQVRCILFEPTLLAMAIESQSVEEQRIRDAIDDALNATIHTVFLLLLRRLMAYIRLSVYNLEMILG
ncbi:unnamed protein product [Strongylus vulgaris]|uniref:Uncharacterized protein n=1 Tax=Strongylus vulgaris TaxID=40348 RepID=A0A3P7LTD2_STRVU|nr:unnamed protein product [Strongylus vulgaris]